MKSFIIALTALTFSALAFGADYDKIVTRLQEAAKKPHVSMFTLGKNDQGTDIVGIIVGDEKSATARHLVVGTHHGNERMAAELPFFFLDQILASYNPAELYYIIPVLNVTGYNANRREETGADQDTHDSNRDYEDACAVKQDFELTSTRLIAEFLGRENILAAVSLHGYVGSFTFPFGMYAKNYATLDNALLASWAKKAAKFNGYKTGTHGDIVYPASGSFEDWAYIKHGIWSFLMEIRSPSQDLKKDAQTLVEFFRSAPTERSRNVGQKIDCVSHILKASNRSRP